MRGRFLTTAATVGYGDVSRLTTGGRVVAVLPMLTGIGFIGIFTATVASFFIEQRPDRDAAKLDARLDALERKVDLLLRERGITER